MAVLIGQVKCRPKQLWEAIQFTGSNEAEVLAFCQAHSVNPTKQGTLAWRRPLELGEWFVVEDGYWSCTRFTNKQFRALFDIEQEG